MEGFGFASAAKRQERDYNPFIGVIRGISDIIGQEGNTEVPNDARPANIKQMASDTASAFAFWLIYKLYTKVK